MSEERLQFQIESGVPIPVRRPRGLFAAVDPIVGQMKVGDSVFLPTASDEESEVMRCRLDSTVRQAAWRNRLSAGWAVRVVEGGVRFWRTR